MGKETDNIFLKHRENDSTDGMFLQYNDRIYACEEKYSLANCFRCVGKANCNNYRLR